MHIKIGCFIFSTVKNLAQCVNNISVKRATDWNY